MDPIGFRYMDPDPQSCRNGSSLNPDPQHCAAPLKNRGNPYKVTITLLFLLLFSTADADVRCLVSKLCEIGKFLKAAHVPVIIFVYRQ